MKNDYTHIVVVLDRSGSMESVATDTIGSFNSFLSEQKAEPGKATFALYKFNHNVDTSKPKPLSDVEPLSDKTYQPGGNTALLDATARAIVDTGSYLDSMTEADRPGKVIVMILTDGYENASREYSKAKVKEMIEHQQTKYNWQFLFLGANQDAFAEAASIGINCMNAVNVSHSAQGYADGIGFASANVKAYRSGATMDASFSVNQQEQMDKLKEQLGK